MSAQNNAMSEATAQVIDENVEEEEPKKSFCTKLYRKFCRDKEEIQTVFDANDLNKLHSIKIIVIGPGNSGKSTILKQMRIIHGNNYNESDRKKYKPLVIQNLLESIVRLVSAMRQVFMQEFDNLENNDHFQLILAAHEELETSPENLDHWGQHSLAYVHAIQSIWSDISIRLAYANRNKFFLGDSTE